jgi:preprotein translocase subunit SecA
MEMHPDRVWATSDRKMQAIVDMVKSEERIVVAAHFSESLERIHMLLEGSGAKEVRSSMDILRWMQGDFPKVGLMLIPNVISISVSPPQTEMPELLIAVCERHPSWIAEEQFMKWLEPFHGYMTYFESLDSPLFRVFGVERIKTLLGALGMSESEAIEHKMVSNALENAQKKIAAKAAGSGPARSAEEWFQNYFPKQD